MKTLFVRRAAIPCGLWLLLAQAQVQASDWSPTVTDTLMALPANIMQKRIEQDFAASPLAQRLSALDNDMTEKSGEITTLKQSLANAQGADATDTAIALVQQKSAFLDVMQESHQLRGEALLKKQRLYQDILTHYQHQQQRLSSPDNRLLVEQRQQALARMERAMSHVDQQQLHMPLPASSPYADEYANNLAQITQLKEAIARHRLNVGLMLDGEDVSAEEYLRQLLMALSMEQSLLDQESLMLGYMARLVALDAQALEYDLMLSSTEGSTSSSAPMNKAAHAAGLFL